MASQVKTRTEAEPEQTEVSKNGTRRIDPSLIIPAKYPLSRIIGKYKDDPYVLEVWDRIIASRHPKRAKKRAGS
jgi:hypothetical protein